MSQRLDPDALLQRARDETGLDDFGSHPFLEGLHQVVDCAADDVTFHESGLDAFRSNIHRALVNRLRVQDALKRNPEILDEDVSDPIIVTGLTRSGTTKMQRMMSAAPGVQRTELWRLLNPAPFPDAGHGQPDPRLAAAGLGGAMSSDDNPDFAAAHISTGGEPEEDAVLFDLTFSDMVWTFVQSPSISYANWVLQRSDLENYRYVRTLLQFLQWQDGGKQGRPWILKAPQHMMRLDAVLDAYPDATFVMTHRDPRETIASMSRFQVVLWSTRTNDIDPHVVGKAVLEWWALAAERLVEARDRLDLDDRMLDVPYAEVRSGPICYAEKAFARAGYPIDAHARQRMLEWEENNEQGVHGKHEYSLEQFGLTPADVDHAFAPYIARFSDFINR